MDMTRNAKHGMMFTKLHMALLCWLCRYAASQNPGLPG